MWQSVRSIGTVNSVCIIIHAHYWRQWEAVKQGCFGDIVNHIIMILWWYHINISLWLWGQSCNPPFMTEKETFSNSVAAVVTGCGLVLAVTTDSPLRIIRLHGWRPLATSHNMASHLQFLWHTYWCNWWDLNGYTSSGECLSYEKHFWWSQCRKPF